MGALKQLLAFEGRTMLSNAISQARGAGFKPIVVVLGAQHEGVAESIKDEQVETTVNPEWSLGMGSSIRAGLKHFEKNGPLPESIAILLTDQPLVRSRQLAEMAELQAKTGAPVVAAEYDGCHGVPAVFAKELFPILTELPIDMGARHLLRDGRLAVVGYPLPEAATDVDTPADLTALESMRP
jgi:molybdenum cofactor cytidylyltransferase